MELPLILQARQFLFSAILGLLYGLLFELLRGLWRCLPWLRHVLDFFFSLCFAAGNVLFALYVGDGEFRIFMLIGIFLGMGLHFLLLRHFFQPVFSVFWRYITWPLRFFARLCKKILEFLKKRVKNSFLLGKNRLQW